MGRSYVWHTSINGRWWAFTMVDGVEVARCELTDDETRARRLPVFKK